MKKTNQMKETMISKKIDQLSEYLTTKEVSQLYPFFGYHTLKDLRYKGISPFPFYRLGKNIRYKRSDIENYINARKVLANVEL